MTGMAKRIVVSGKSELMQRRDLLNPGVGGPDPIPIAECLWCRLVVVLRDKGEYPPDHECAGPGRDIF